MGREEEIERGRAPGVDGAAVAAWHLLGGQSEVRWVARVVGVGGDAGVEGHVRLWLPLPGMCRCMSTRMPAEAADYC